MNSRCLVASVGSGSSATLAQSLYGPSPIPLSCTPENTIFIDKDKSRLSSDLTQASQSASHPQKKTMRTTRLVVGSLASLTALSSLVAFLMLHTETAGPCSRAGTTAAAYLLLLITALAWRHANRQQTHL